MTENLEQPAAAASAPPRPLPRALLATLLLFAAVAVWTRFANLGNRLLHHDESIHAYMSNTLAKDGNCRAPAAGRPATCAD